MNTCGLRRPIRPTDRALLSPPPFLPSPSRPSWMVRYREIQKPLRAFSPPSQATLTRLVDFAFPDASTPLLPLHLLDLEPTGYISRHVDHVDYSGPSIVGLSLLSGAVMTLHHQPPGPGRQASDGRGVGGAFVAMRLPRRSLYILRGEARYDWAHAIAPGAGEDGAGHGSDGTFTSTHGPGAPGLAGLVPEWQRRRRVAFIMRDELRDLQPPQPRVEAACNPKAGHDP